MSSLSRYAAAGIAALVIAAAAVAAVVVLARYDDPNPSLVGYALLATPLAVGGVCALVGRSLRARLAALVGGLAGISVPWFAFSDPGTSGDPDLYSALTQVLAISAGAIYLVGFGAVVALPHVVGWATSSERRPPPRWPPANHDNSLTRSPPGSGACAPRTFGHWAVAAPDRVFPAGTEVEIRGEGGRLTVASKAFSNILVDAEVTTSRDARLLVIATDSRSLKLSPLDGQSPEVVVREMSADAAVATP